MNARPRIDLDHVSRLWNDGLPVADIAARCRMTPASVTSLAYNYRDLFPSRQTGNRVPDAEYLQAQLRTMSVNALSKLIGVTVHAINVKLRRAGMPRGRERKRRPDPIAAVPCAPAGRVVRTTFAGAKVTMPRLIFLDGPAQ